MLKRPSVEYNLTDHCNLRCTACARGSPLLDEKFSSVEQFARELGRLSGALHCTELRIGGGEPLLHPQLLDFLRAARASGVADEVVLLTNGVLLHQAPEELWELIDGMWLSLYPGVTIRIPIAECERLAREHGVKLSVRQADEFSHILLNQRNEDTEAVELVYRACKAAREWSCHTVHEGRFYKCSTAPFTAQRLALLGGRFSENARDFVSLDRPSLPEALSAYLADERPLAACAFCLGSSGPSLPNRQLNREALVASKTEDHRATAALVAQVLMAERDRDASRAGLEGARAELAAARESLGQVASDLRELRGSWSWRLSAPLRWLGRLVRGR
jgi:organic radical activating enzyme